MTGDIFEDSKPKLIGAALCQKDEELLRSVRPAALEYAITRVTGCVVPAASWPQRMSAASFFEGHYKQFVDLLVWAMRNNGGKGDVYTDDLLVCIALFQHVGFYIYRSTGLDACEYKIDKIIERIAAVIQFEIDRRERE